MHRYVAIPESEGVQKCLQIGCTASNNKAQPQAFSPAHQRQHRAQPHSLEIPARLKSATVVGAPDQKGCNACVTASSATSIVTDNLASAGRADVQQTQAARLPLQSATSWEHYHLGVSASSDVLEPKPPLDRRFTVRAGVCRQWTLGARMRARRRGH